MELPDPSLEVTIAIVTDPSLEVGSVELPNPSLGVTTVTDGEASDKSGRNC